MKGYYIYFIASLLFLSKPALSHGRHLADTLERAVVSAERGCLSSVLDISTSDGSADSYSGSFSIGLLADVYRGKIKLM